MRILPKDPKTARQTPLFCLKSKAIVGLPYLKVCEPLSVFAGFVHQNFDFWQKVAFFLELAKGKCHFLAIFEKYPKNGVFFGSTAAQIKVLYSDKNFSAIKIHRKNRRHLEHSYIKE